MENLPIHLLLHGTSVMIVSLVAGLLLHRAIRLNGNVAGWHLAHSGTSGRALWLIALAPVFRWVALPTPQVLLAVWLIVFFVWTSVLAMIVAAATGQRGLRWRGSSTDKLVFGLYAVGAVAVFPAMFMLIAGLLRAL